MRNILTIYMKLKFHFCMHAPKAPVIIYNLSNTDIKKYNSIQKQGSECFQFFFSFCNFEMFKFQQLVKKLKTRENHYHSLTIIPGSICHFLTCLWQISQQDN